MSIEKGTQGGVCTCGHSEASQVAWPGGPRVTICNLTDCTLPWAVSYRRRVRVHWYDRIISTVIVFLIGRKP